MIQKSMRYSCKYAVYDAALGGRLYELIYADALPEKMARMYFRELIAGI